MNILLILAIIYLAIGVVYGLYIFLFGADKWYLLPVNILGGPILLLYFIFHLTFMKDK